MESDDGTAGEVKAESEVQEVPQEEKETKDVEETPSSEAVMSSANEESLMSVEVEEKKEEEEEEEEVVMKEASPKKEDVGDTVASEEFEEKKEVGEVAEESAMEESSQIMEEVKKDEEPAAPVPAPASVSTAVETKSHDAQIQQENIKTQLYEIINEIDLEVGKQEDGLRQHTWKPKGKYEMQRTDIVYEDIVPVEVPDVQHKELTPVPTPAVPVPQQNGIQDETDQRQGSLYNFQNLQGLQVMGMNGELVTMDIPEGIPLLARILPKEGDEGREKIPLERLFTPATDSGEITPKKKKVFSSSCFYRPDHPTIDDQVELAQRISGSLVADQNQTSRGQSMYMKRKKRSSKWIHQASGGQNEFEEEQEMQTQVTQSQSSNKLMLNTSIQDYSTIPQQQQQVQLQQMSLAAGGIQQMHSPEVLSKEIAGDLQSPTGKGAQLFAKRKKRMDKYIVDETTVQKQKQTSFESSSTAFQQMSSTTFSQQQRQQTSSMASEAVSSSVQAPLQGNPPQDGGAIYTAEVKVVQKPAAPKMPVLEFPALPEHILESTDSEAEKRKSFNLAAKGWGTYANHYTPVHLGAR